MMVRGVRGATTVEADNAEVIWEATRELLNEIIQANGIVEDDVASVFFTTTPDLKTAYPARAAREMGWTRTALIGMQESPVEGGLERCIRILIHWNTDKTLDELQHCFLRRAVALRPDLEKPKKTV